MDKFIVRTPRIPVEKQEEKSKAPKLKQATIKSLARVVVVEDIIHLKSSLEIHRNDECPNKLLEILEQLKIMNPSKEVLQQTRIGRTVNSLRRCGHQSVKQLSKNIVNKWKKLVEEECTVKECIDVRCDARTELSRCKARKLIADALDSKLPNACISNIEKRLFHECQRRINNVYKRNVRSLVFLLKRDHQMKENVKQGTVSPQEVLSKSFRNT